MLVSIEEEANQACKSTTVEEKDEKVQSDPQEIPNQGTQASNDNPKLTTTFDQSLPEENPNEGTQASTVKPGGATTVDQQDKKAQNGPGNGQVEDKVASTASLAPPDEDAVSINTNTCRSSFFSNISRRTSQIIHSFRLRRTSADRFQLELKLAKQAEFGRVKMLFYQSFYACIDHEEVPETHADSYEQLDDVAVKEFGFPRLYLHHYIMTHRFFYALILRLSQQLAPALTEYDTKITEVEKIVYKRDPGPARVSKIISRRKMSYSSLAINIRPEYETMASTVRHELHNTDIIQKATKNKKYALEWCACRWILRIHRYMNFIHRFMSNVAKAGPNEGVDHMITDAYNNTLKANHSWTTRMKMRAGILAMSLTMRSCRRREELITDMGEVTGYDCNELLQEVTWHIGYIIEKMNQLLNAHDLLELP